MLNELVPGTPRFAVLVNPNSADTENITADARAAAAMIGKQVEFFTATNTRQIDRVFADIMQRGYYDRRAAEVGGLMSYGANIPDAVRQTGIYTARVLKGEKTADLPVIQAVKFEFVINLQTARSWASRCRRRFSRSPTM